ncbi:MAG TPA: glycosyltransferase family 2 protein [Solirubrobacteraceae bacterium]|nr:glycosyltransferase family 2 protein [Solirubrobacteraceae bacterium]
MLVSAVVVNLDARELLLACVASIEAALARVDGPTEILVVDNGSTDGAPAALADAHPAARVLAFAENRGFAAAANAGIAATTGDWVLLLNNDATLEPTAVAELVRAAADRPDVGALAAQMRFAADGRINSAGFGVDRLGVAFERHIGRDPHDGEHEPTPVFGASAGAALMRRAMLAELGGFDATFFLYLEDVDLAWRARMRGWECLYVPAAVAHHRHSATSRHGSPFKHFHVGRNRVRLLAKHLPAGHLLVYGPAILAYDLAYCVFAAITDRTLMPARGRAAGLREWSHYRRAGAARRPVALAPVEGPWRALRRRRGTLRGGSGATPT